MLTDNLPSPSVKLSHFYLLQSHWANFNKLSTKHPLVKGTHVGSNVVYTSSGFKFACLMDNSFMPGDNLKIVKNEACLS